MSDKLQFVVVLDYICPDRQRALIRDIDKLKFIGHF